MPNEVNVNRYQSSMRDFSGERSSFAFSVAAQTDNAAFLTAMSNFEDAVDAMTVGVRSNRNVSLYTDISNSNAASPTAQRENKMLLRYSDNVTGKGYSVTIPTLDLANAGIVAGSDNINLENPSLGYDMKLAFEAFASSPDGNSVTLNSARFVGRNL